MRNGWIWYELNVKWYTCAKKSSEVTVFAGKPRGTIRMQCLIQEFAYEFCSWAVFVWIRTRFVWIRIQILYFECEVVQFCYICMWNGVIVWIQDFANEFCLWDAFARSAWARIVARPGTKFFVIILPPTSSSALKFQTVSGLWGAILFQANGKHKMQSQNKSSKIKAPCPAFYS